MLGRKAVIFLDFRVKYIYVCNVKKVSISNDLFSSFKFSHAILKLMTTFSISVTHFLLWLVVMNERR